MKFKVGDKVKIKDNIDFPEYNWSNNTTKPEKGLIGVISSIVDDMIFIDFPTAKHFLVFDHEIELSK